jgi:hypothetical protein
MFQTFQTIFDFGQNLRFSPPQGEVKKLIQSKHSFYRLAILPFRFPSILKV